MNACPNKITAGVATIISAVPSGLRRRRTLDPSLERLGYFHLSLRDTFSPNYDKTFARHHTGDAFTLVEVILALAISAVVLAAICGVFTGAVRLREKTSAALETALPLTEALDTLRQDLQSAIGPSNVLAGDFKCGGATMGENMGLSSAEGVGLDFFTTSAVINDDEPWGDLQEVFYQLTDAVDRNQPGKDLVRYVNRNLLASGTSTPDKQWLVGSVASVQFDCYDGLQWRNTWDTSMGDTNLPSAVRVRIQLTRASNGGLQSQQPLEMIVPIVCQARTNQMTGGIQ